MSRPRVVWSPGVPDGFWGRLHGQLRPTHSATVWQPRGERTWCARVDMQAQGAIAEGPISEHRTLALAKRAAARRLCQAARGL